MADAQRRSQASTTRAAASSHRFWAVLGGVLAVSVVTVAGLGVAYGDKLLCGLGSHNSTCALSVLTPTDGGRSDAVARMSAPDGDGRWASSFLLAVDNGVDLDSDQPTAVSGSAGDLDDGDLFYDNRTTVGSKLFTADHPLAVWSPSGSTSGSPTADACADAIATAGVWSVQPVPGQVLCVQSTGGSLAALTVQQVQPDAVDFGITLFD
jgi:hypothetical protein